MSEIKVIDFDALFNKYFEKWYMKNAEKYSGPDEIEDLVPKLYQKWISEYNELAGCKPCEFYNGFSADLLLRHLSKLIASDCPVSELLTDAIVKTGQDTKVFEALNAAKSHTEKIYLMNILEEMRSLLPLDLYERWAFDRAVDGELSDHAAEILKAHAKEVADKLLKKVHAMSYEKKLIAGDILSGVQGDERVYKLLVDCLKGCENLEIAASYLAKFGDERAIPLLTEYIEREEINYLEFLELRNAIEALGGTVSVKRDFSEDPIYKRMKGKLAF